IAVAAVLLGKLDNIGRQTLLVLTAARHLALRRAMPPPAERDKLLSIDLNSSIDVLAKVKPDETRPEGFALAVDPNKKMAATLSWFPSNNLPIPTLHVLNIGPGTEIFRISDVGVSKGSGYAVAISQNLEFVAAAYRRGEMHDTPTAKIWKLPEGKEHLAI